MYFIHLIRINYLITLTYFPIFLYFVDFSKVAAASPPAAAAAASAAQLAAEPQPQIGLRSKPHGHASFLGK